VLVDYTCDEHTLHRHIYMAEVGIPANTSNENNNELLKQISEDEVTTNTGNETNAQREGSRLKNQRCAERRRNAAARQC
jgi:hypothetical protein